MVVYVYQTDNRPQLDYVKKTRSVNENYCKLLNYEYIFEEMKIEGSGNGDFHPCQYKIMMVNKLIKKLDKGILVFLDSDAWIKNPLMLSKIIETFPEDKHGMFSRDPYLKHNTFINSGSFIIKINEYTKNMYNILEKQSRENPRWVWPRDQFYISNYVYDNKDNFIIYKPDILNTPIGKILCHNWSKNFSKCVILKKHDEFNLENTIDDEPFPNKDVKGYEYRK